MLLPSVEGAAGSSEHPILGPLGPGEPEGEEVQRFKCFNSQSSLKWFKIDLKNLLLHYPEQVLLLRTEIQHVYLSVMLNIFAFY